jgi:hypothetical protein
MSSSPRLPLQSETGASAQTVLPFHSPGQAQSFSLYLPNASVHILLREIDIAHRIESHPLGISRVPDMEGTDHSPPFQDRKEESKDNPSKEIL